MKARQVFGLLLIGACVVIVGIMDKQDAELEHKAYCNNVREGVWPDYKPGRYKDECGGKDPPPFNEDLTK